MAKHPLDEIDDLPIQEVLAWLCSRGWHIALYPDRGMDGILGMRRDEHTGQPIYCSVLQAWQAEAASLPLLGDEG